MSALDQVGGLRPPANLLFWIDDALSTSLSGPLAGSPMFSLVVPRRLGIIVRP